jgi:hypothetical protein
MSSAGPKVANRYSVFPFAVASPDDNCENLY